MNRIFVFCVFALLLAACGSDDTNPGTREDATPREGYPAAPYGTAEGTTLADLSFTTIAGAPLTLQDVYADGGNKLLLISTAAGWCTACIEEQPKLQSLHDRYYDAGLFVMVTYFEDGNFVAAEPSMAEDWKTRYDLTFDVVADPAFSFESYYDSNLTPMNMIVDVSSMEILFLRTGFDESAIEAIIEARLK